MKGAVTRLLMTTDTIGGVWQYSLDLADGLRRHGIETLLAITGPAPDAGQRAEAEAVATLVDAELPLDWLCDAPAPVLAAGERLAALAARLRVDCVQLNMPTLGARTRFGVPVVAVTHGCVATWWEAARQEPLGADYRWQRALMREGLQAADAVVAPSIAYAATVARHYGLRRLPVAVHNGRRPLGAAGEGPSAPHAFTAGRLWDGVKNTGLLDRVAGAIAAPFRAAGPVTGPHGETVTIDHLVALGRLDAATLAGELAQRPVFVSAATFEPFGLAVLEAAAMGCALVLSDIGTFRELWSDAALFVAADDAEGYATAIRRVLHDALLRRDLEQAAAERARLYIPAAMAASMAGLYESLADARRRAAA